MTEPHLDVDLFSTEALIDPWPRYQAIRDAGPAVFLDRYDMWALGRYEELRPSLRDWQTFSSAQGTALNAAANGRTHGRLLTSDPPEHDRLRSVLAHRLLPRQLRGISDSIQERADALVDEVVERGEFDTVTDLAQALPLGIVLDLIGLPHEGREKVLQWADAAFAAQGPEGQEAVEAFPVLQEQINYLATTATREQLAPGSMGRAIYEAADEGKIDPESCVPLMSAYLTAGLDTTINAIGNAVFYFAHHPDQWDLVRQDPAMAPQAFNEILRIESPVQFFTRVATRDVTFGDAVIPAGARFLMMFASANRDERRWENPTVFDVRRDAREHIAFGHGVHGCAGQALARIEGQAMIAALARRVARFEVGTPERRLNQVIRGFKSLPTSVTAA